MPCAVPRRPAPGLTLTPRSPFRPRSYRGRRPERAAARPLQVTWTLCNWAADHCAGADLRTIPAPRYVTRAREIVIRMTRLFG